MSILSHALEELSLLDPSIGLDLETEYGSDWQDQLSKAISENRTTADADLLTRVNYNNKRGWEVDWGKHLAFYKSRDNKLETQYTHAGNISEAPSELFNHVKMFLTYQSDIEKYPDFEKGCLLTHFYPEQSYHSVLSSTIPTSWKHAVDLKFFYCRRSELTQAEVRNLLSSFEKAVKAGLASKSKKVTIYTRYHDVKRQSTSVDHAWLAENGWQRLNKYKHKKVIGDVTIDFVDNDEGKVSPREN